MNIEMIRSDACYEKILESPIEKRNDIYRYALAKPFEFKWSCVNVPLKTSVEGGYDVIMASTMMGVLPPTEMEESHRIQIDAISDTKLWENCRDTIEKALGCFQKVGVELPVKDYRFTMLLANPESPYISLSEGYLGDGGIPGYILVAIVPNAYTLERLPVALAHECHHNVRFQFEKWHNDITLGEMMVCEGLAENFATWLYGEELVGPWVSKTDLETLESYIKPIIKDQLHVTGFDNISAYLWGDALAALQGFFPQGMPYCAGYACGYHLIKHYLEKTGKSIVEATLVSSKEILEIFGDKINKMGEMWYTKLKITPLGGFRSLYEDEKMASDWICGIGSRFIWD